ncbi:DNA adenine methylase [Stenotrophomonas sp. LARHCG68]
MAFITPLRYPGGKGRLGHWLADVVRANGLTGGEYIEPYAGGAGAALYLLQQDLVARIHINDIDPIIYTFWQCAVDDSKRLADMVRAATVTIAARETAKQIVRNFEGHEPLQVAYSAFLLNRTSRSGILRGGPIGGRTQAGKYKLDARFNRDGLAQRIEAIGSYRKRIKVTNIDALDLLSEPTRRKKRLTYCDPPYYVKGKQLYTNYYHEADHRKVADQVLRLKTPWIVTYDDHPDIVSLYECASSLRFQLHYSTHMKRPKATELMFHGNLKLPVNPYLHR